MQFGQVQATLFIRGLAEDEAAALETAVDGLLPTGCALRRPPSTVAAGNLLESVRMDNGAGAAAAAGGN